MDRDDGGTGEGGVKIEGSFGVLDVHQGQVDVSMSGYHEYVPGRTSYMLNGEPIGEDEARRLIESVKQDGGRDE